MAKNPLANLPKDIPIQGTAFIVPKDGKFVTVLDGKQLAFSKWPDYVQHHLKLGDVKKIKEANFERLCYVTARGKVEKVVSTSMLTAPKTDRMQKVVRQMINNGPLGVALNGADVNEMTYNLIVRRVK